MRAHAHTPFLSITRPPSCLHTHTRCLSTFLALSLTRSPTGAELQAAPYISHKRRKVVIQVPISASSSSLSSSAHSSASSSASVSASSLSLSSSSSSQAMDTYVYTTTGFPGWARSLCLSLCLSLSVSLSVSLSLCVCVCVRGCSSCSFLRVLDASFDDYIRMRLALCCAHISLHLSLLSLLSLPLSFCVNVCSHHDA